MNAVSKPKYVSFDCYGTLIHFEIAPTTKELVGDRLSPSEFDQFIVDFRGIRYDQVCGEFYPYQQVLHDSFARTCRKWGLEVNQDAGERLAEAVRSWGPHADVPIPLKTMGQEYRLVILSNADTSFLDISVPKLGAEFHAVFTAEQAGFYKPRYGAFEYMLEQLDAEPGEFMHISSHTRYDLMPAYDLGFRNLVLLDRGYDLPSPAYGYTRVESLDEVNVMLEAAESSA